MNNKIISVIVGGILVAGIAFYAGDKVGGAHAQTTGGRGMFSSQGGFGGMRGMRGGNFASGDIISKDSTSITVKLQDGGSKIIFFATSTPISKSVSGSASDLTVGTRIVVNGTPNQDGSLNASTIQIRPAGTTGFGPGAGMMPAPTQNAAAN